MSFSFFFSSRRRHTRCLSDWSSDVCSSDLLARIPAFTIGSIFSNQPMVNAGILASLLIPSDALWKGASFHLQPVRSEERRVGKECRKRWAADASQRQDVYEQAEGRAARRQG